MTEQTAHVPRYRKDQRPPTRVRPMSEPHPSDLHTAQLDGPCKRKGCKKRIFIGDECAWMWNPDRDLNDPRSKDLLVHLECWSDAEWEYFNQEEPPLRVVDEDHKFSWSVLQMRKGGSVRRRSWKKGKHLMVVVFPEWEDMEVVYVITSRSKDYYTYPRYDTEATDWELM